MLQDRQFNDPRFLGHYWLVGSTLDLALKIFLFYFVSFSKRNGAQWNNDKSFTDQAEPDLNRSQSTDTWLSKRVLLFVSKLVMRIWIPFPNKGIERLV